MNESCTYTTEIKWAIGLYDPTIRFQGHGCKCSLSNVLSFTFLLLWLMCDKIMAFGVRTHNLGLNLISTSLFINESSKMQDMMLDISDC